MNPAAQQRQRDIDRRKEQDEEDRELHDGAGLHRAEPHRHACRPEQSCDVEQQRQRVEAEEIDPVTADVHADRECDHGQDRRGRHPAADRRGCVAQHDPGPVRRGQ